MCVCVRALCEQMCLYKYLSVRRVCVAREVCESVLCVRCVEVWGMWVCVVCILVCECMCVRACVGMRVCAGVRCVCTCV